MNENIDERHVIIITDEDGMVKEIIENINSE